MSLEDKLRELRQRDVQAIHAGISRRDWWAVETAANDLRDKIDRMLQPPPTGVARDGIEAQRGLNDIWPGDPYPPEPARAALPAREEG